METTTVYKLGVLLAIYVSTWVSVAWLFAKEARVR